MAYYAELKRRQWYKINGGNAIWWYKRKLYEDWYASLTEEQKERLEESKRKEAERRKRDAEVSLNTLLSVATMMAGFAQSTNSKYGDMYDEFGSLRK